MQCGVLIDKDGALRSHVNTATDQNRDDLAAGVLLEPAGGKSLLSIRLQYDDYSPDYCSESCILDAFTSSPDPSSDTVEYGMRQSSYNQMYFSIEDRFAEIHIVPHILLNCLLQLSVRMVCQFLLFSL